MQLHTNPQQQLQIQQHPQSLRPSLRQPQQQPHNIPQQQQQLTQLQIQQQSPRPSPRQPLQEGQQHSNGSSIHSILLQFGYHHALIDRALHSLGISCLLAAQDVGQDVMAREVDAVVGWLQSECAPVDGAQTVTVRILCCISFGSPFILE